MDLLDRLLGHDLWTTRQLLLLCQNLSDDQFDREHDIGHRTLRETLRHMIFNVEAWYDCMQERPIDKKTGVSISELIDRLDRAFEDFARFAREIREAERCDATYIDPVNGKQRTFGGTIAHVITHNMHHRAQILYMLRLTGVENIPEGDVLSWERETGTTTI